MPKNSCGYRENSTSTQYKYIWEDSWWSRNDNASIKYRWASCHKLYNAGEFDGQQFADIHLQDLIKLVFSWSVLLEQGI
jgi:hypothetical protein